MDEDGIKLITHELRALMGILLKMTRANTEQRLAEHEISGLQLGVMHALTFDGSATLSELSRKFILDPSTLVPVVDGLEKKQLISRERDPNDRRRFPLSITEQGRAILNAVDFIGDDSPLLLGLQTMDESEVQILMQLMRKLVQQLPEGDNILNSVQSRINGCYNEEKKHAGNCD